MEAAIEFWHMADPSLVEGSREVRLGAYRDLRDGLLTRSERRRAAETTVCQVAFQEPFQAGGLIRRQSCIFKTQANGRTVVAIRI